jgi:hypothetical protein
VRKNSNLCLQVKTDPDCREEHGKGGLLKGEDEEELNREGKIHQLSDEYLGRNNRVKPGRI